MSLKDLRQDRCLVKAYASPATERYGNSQKSKDWQFFVKGCRVVIATGLAWTTVNNMILHALSLHTQWAENIGGTQPRCKNYLPCLSGFPKILIPAQCFAKVAVEDSRLQICGVHDKMIGNASLGFQLPTLLLWPSGCTPSTPVPDTFAVWRMKLLSDQTSGIEA